MTENKKNPELLTVTDIRSLLIGATTLVKEADLLLLDTTRLAVVSNLTTWYGTRAPALIKGRDVSLKLSQFYVDLEPEALEAIDNYDNIPVPTREYFRHNRPKADVDFSHNDYLDSLVRMQVKPLGQVAYSMSLHAQSHEQDAAYANPGPLSVRAETWDERKPCTPSHNYKEELFDLLQPIIAYGNEKS